MAHMQLQCEFASDSGKHFSFEDCSSEEGVGADYFIVFSLLVCLDVKEILNRSLDSFHVLLWECAVKLPTFYAVVENIFLVVAEIR